MSSNNPLEKSPLGKPSAYVSTYAPGLLFPILRKSKRDEIGVPEILPFHGVDIWNSYELSWLNSKGKPLVALCEFRFPCTSPYIIESKSFKLYLNSFNQFQIKSPELLHNILAKDLSAAVNAPVFVKLILPHEFNQQDIQEKPEYCLDHLDVEIDTYQVNPEFLKVEDDFVSETLFSNLLKSNCLVTGQPDWAQLRITYSGPKINHESLLKYIISFREHNEFHEQCIERIFMDLMQGCRPEKLTVYGRYTRRGGLDINPYRSNVQGEEGIIPENIRHSRQ